MYKNRNNYNFKDNKGEINNSPSLTVENDSYTIRELFERNSGHLRDEVSRQEVYYDQMDHDDPDYNEISNADLIEKSEAIEQQTAKDIEKARKKKKVAEKPLKEATKEKKNKTETEEESKTDKPNSTDNPS